MIPFVVDSEPLFDQASRADVDDAAVAVRTVGRGPHLVLVHGFPVHGETWRKLLPALAEKWTCHVFDMPGFGLSRWSKSSRLSFTAQAERLRKAITAMGLDRYALLAHDTGGTIARLLAHCDPERVTHLALINTEMPGHRPPWIPTYQRLSLLPGAVAGFRMIMRSRAYRRSAMGLGGLFVDKDLLDGDFHRLFIEPLIKDPRRMQGLPQFLRDVEWDVVDGLTQMHQALRPPVRLIWGEDCVTFPLARAEQMATQFRNSAGIVRIRNAALMPHEEQPAQVLAALTPFLEAAPVA